MASVWVYVHMENGQIYKYTIITLLSLIFHHQMLDNWKKTSGKTPLTI
jgi:hypothetical protein